MLAYSVPILWWQRIIWQVRPSHYLFQDLTDVWLDQ